MEGKGNADTTQDKTETRPRYALPDLCPQSDQHEGRIGRGGGRAHQIPLFGASSQREALRTAPAGLRTDGTPSLAAQAAAATSYRLAPRCSAVPLLPRGLAGCTHGPGRPSYPWPSTLSLGRALG